MRNTGMTRAVDKLGRVVLPMEIRKNSNINTGDDLEIYVEDGNIVLRKFTPNCIFCGSVENVKDFKGQVVCHECANEIAD